MRRGVTVESVFAGPAPKDYRPTARAVAAYVEHCRICRAYGMRPENRTRYCWEFDLCGEHESERGARPRYEPHRESSLASAIRMMAHEDPRMNWSGKPKKIPGKRGPKAKRAREGGEKG